MSQMRAVVMSINGPGRRHRLRLPAPGSSQPPPKRSRPTAQLGNPASSPSTTSASSVPSYASSTDPTSSATDTTAGASPTRLGAPGDDTDFSASNGTHGTLVSTANNTAEEQDQTASSLGAREAAGSSSTNADCTGWPSPASTMSAAGAAFSASNSNAREEQVSSWSNREGASLPAGQVVSRASTVQVAGCPSGHEVSLPAGGAASCTAMEQEGSWASGKEVPQPAGQVVPRVSTPPCPPRRAHTMLAHSPRQSRLTASQPPVRSPTGPSRSPGHAATQLRVVLPPGASAAEVSCAHGEGLPRSISAPLLSNTSPPKRARWSSGMLPDGSWVGPACNDDVAMAAGGAFVRGRWVLQVAEGPCADSGACTACTACTPGKAASTAAEGSTTPLDVLWRGVRRLQRKQQLPGCNAAFSSNALAAAAAAPPALPSVWLYCDAGAARRIGPILRGLCDELHVAATVAFICGRPPRCLLEV